MKVRKLVKAVLTGGEARMIKIIAVGKCKEKATRELIEEYLKRLGAYTKIEMIEVNDEQTPDRNSSAQNEEIKRKEGERILSKIQSDEYVILLDLQGKMLSSEGLSEKIDSIQTYQSSKLTFIIGGSLGVSEDIKKRSDFKWQLSALTFPHQIVRILLVEQVYRAFKIHHHEPYHK